MRSSKNSESLKTLQNRCRPPWKTLMVYPHHQSDWLELIFILGPAMMKIKRVLSLGRSPDACSLPASCGARCAPRRGGGPPPGTWWSRSRSPAARGCAAAPPCTPARRAERYPGRGGSSGASAGRAQHVWRQLSWTPANCQCICSERPPLLCAHLVPDIDRLPCGPR